MHAAILQFQQSEIHYVHFGDGANIVICLHGFAQDAESFLELENFLSKEFILIAIDLPFHGATDWNENRPFDIGDLDQIIKKILINLGMPLLQFIMLGYSMGGRLAMSFFEVMPEKVSKLILIAPDGMTVNFWYWLATQTAAGNQLFRFTMNHPAWFFNVISVSNTLKFVNKSVIKFSQSIVGEKELRIQLFNRWTCMRRFSPNLEKIRKIIRQKQLPVRMLFGKHDRIIVADRAFRFCKGLEPCCEVHVIEAGHNILQKKYATFIVKMIVS